MWLVWIGVEKMLFWSNLRFALSLAKKSLALGFTSFSAFATFANQHIGGVFDV